MRFAAFFATTSLLALAACNKPAEVQSSADDVEEVDVTWTYYAFYPIEEVEVEEVEVPTTVSRIKANADDWYGRSIEGRVNVTSTPTDRGFWIEGPAGGEMFALIQDAPHDAYKDIDPDQTLYLFEADVYGPQHMERFDTSAEPLERDSKEILREQSAYLVVDEADLMIMPS